MDIKTQGKLMSIQIKRPQELAKNILFVDGLQNSGKTLLAPLLCNLENSELWQFDHLFEYICALVKFDKIDQNAAETLIRLYADTDLYNSMIGRQTNMRPTDVSSAPNNLLKDKYMERLASEEGDRVVRRIREGQPAIAFMLHYVFSDCDILFQALGNNLQLYLLMIRYPLFLIDSWVKGSWHQGIQRQYGGNWWKRFGLDPREVTLCAEVDGEVMPWFVVEWKDEYLQATDVERSILMVIHLTESFKRKYAALEPSIRERVFLIPYERFSVLPIDYLKKIAKMTGTSLSLQTNHALSHLGLPRNFSPEIIEKKKSECMQLFKEQRVRPSLLSRLSRLCEEYEQEHLHCLLDRDLAMRQGYL